MKQAVIGPAYCQNLSDIPRASGAAEEVVAVCFPSQRLQERWGLDGQEGFPHELPPSLASKILAEENAGQWGAVPTERRPEPPAGVALESKVFASQRELGQIEGAPDVPVQPRPGVIWLRNPSKEDTRESLDVPPRADSLRKTRKTQKTRERRSDAPTSSPGPAHFSTK